MSTYREHDIEKLEKVPLVQDTAHPDESDDDDGAAGALVALDGPPVNGGVPTYNSGTGKHTSQVPGAAPSSPFDDPAFGAARQAFDDARFLGGTTSSTLDEYQVQLIAQFYGA